MFQARGSTVIFAYFPGISRHFVTIYANESGLPACTVRDHGQMYPVPAGDLKQPTDSGKACRGSHNTASGTKIVNAIAAKKIR
jgi:hypothetical protein